MLNEVKHRALVPISFDLLRLLGAQEGDTIQCLSNDLPADASVVNTSYSWEQDCLMVCIESAQLAPNIAGDYLPRLNGPILRVVPADQPLLVPVKE